MMDKAVRFKVVFNGPDPEREPVESAVAGRSAVVEMTAEQVATIAAIMDELGATAHAWNLRLNTSDDNVVPDEALLVDAELEIALPFVVGDKERPFDEDRPGIADWEPVGDDAPFENPQTARWVSIDAGWMRAFLSVGGVLAPLPMDALLQHFATGAPLLAYVYTDEPCRVCGRLITRSDVAESRYAGYSGGEGPRSMRAMHGRCYEGVLAVMDDYERQRMTARPDFPEPGEPVRIFLNAERGPNGDRWLVEPVGGGLPSIVKDELVAGWQRRPSAEAKP